MMVEARRFLPDILRAGLVLLATWPIWTWYADTILISPEARVGPFSALLGVWFLSRERGSLPKDSWIALALLAVASVALSVPPAIAALLTFGSMGLILVRWPLRSSVLPGWCLLMLGLPLIEQLQFYLGHPLRNLASGLAAQILQLQGLEVVPRGAVLVLGNREVIVDAPCSGVKMLWAAGVLWAAAAGILGLTPIRMAIAAVTSVGLVVAGNSLRAASLFLSESGLVPAPSHAHEFVGIAMYVLTCAAILFIVYRLRPPAVHQRSVRHGPGQLRTWPRASLWLASLLAALLPIVVDPAPAAPSSNSFPGWPSHFEDRPLIALGIDGAEARLLDQMAVRAQRFRAGPDTVVLRWTDRPTRDMHLATLCYRFGGYRLTEHSVRQGPSGERWGHYIAARNGERISVRQRIVDSEGRTFLDESSWYWAALTGESRGPWLATTAARAAPD